MSLVNRGSDSGHGCKETYISTFVLKWFIDGTWIRLFVESFIWVADELLEKLNPNKRINELTIQQSPNDLTFQSP